MSQISCGAVVCFAQVVGRIELDEARAPVAQQVDRQQTHLALELLLDLRDHVRAGGSVRRGIAGIFRSRFCAARRASRQRQVSVRAAQLRPHLRADRVEARRVRLAVERVAVLRVPDAEHEEERGC